MSGRKCKEGLEYFELDCHLDDKIRLMQAEYGLKGFAVVVKLFQKIYGEHGYYSEWDEDRLLLFMSENGVPSDNKNLIQDIVSACIRRHIFSEDMFNKYQILTSSGIQTRYLSATSKRECVSLIREYLLVEVDQNRKNVVINGISSVKNAIIDGRNTQRREEKRRVEKSKEEEIGAQKRTTAAQLIEEMGFNPGLEQTVKEWVKYKSERREGYKETGLRNLLTQINGKAAEFGDAPVIDMIQDAMANNWKGFHLERLYEGKKTTRSEQIRNRVKEVANWQL